MTLETVRKTAQITLAAVAVVAASAAGYRYFAQTSPFFGKRIEAVPVSGPVGVRAFLQPHGYGGDQKVTIYLCDGATSELGDCIELAKTTGNLRVQAKPIPKTFPDSSEVAERSYVLRAGPEDGEKFPVRGSFEVVPFTVGKAARPRVSYVGVDPASLDIGPAREIARGMPCRAPLYLPDGRLALGGSVVDPETRVTIEVGIDASELVWSPVGDKVAILTLDRKEIRLAGPEGNAAVVKVREARGFLSSLSWSPQGDRLAFISENDPSTRGGPGPPTVRILNATNGQITAAGPGLAVAWSPNAEVLAVEMSGPRIELSTPGGARRQYGPGKRPTWSPDGALLGFVRAGESGRDEGWLGQAEGSRRSPVVTGPVCSLSFSPSGDTLAVVGDVNGTKRLFLRSVGPSTR